MNIIFLAYQIDNSASGIINQRILNEMSHRFEAIYVITSKADHIIDNNIHYIIDNNNLNRKSLLGKIYYYILKQLTGDSYNFNLFWRKRAYKSMLRVIRENKIDWIYSRTTPLDSCVVGVKVAKKNSIKLFQHFTDPFPPIKEYLTRRKLYNYYKRITLDVFSYAKVVSFGNIAMKKYMLHELGIQDSNRYIISPDAASQTVINRMLLPNNDCITLVYLGSIYSSRNPKPLLGAIEKLNNLGVHCQLVIYQNKQESDYPFVHFVNRTSNIIKAMSGADILVDIDGDDSIPLFISSKLKDYLTIDRPILSISPYGSPTREIIKDCRSCKCCSNEQEEIYKAIYELSTNQIPFEAYAEREAILRQFDVCKIVDDIVEIMKN